MTLQHLAAPQRPEPRPVAPDPFLEAIRAAHRLRDLAESVDPEDRDQIIRTHPDVHRAWALRARREQLPPTSLERTWVYLGGRAAGKTMSMTSAAHLAVEAGIQRMGIIGATSADVRDVIVEGKAGLLATAPQGMRPSFVETRRKVTWPNGATALTFSAEEPESLRGPEFELVLIDEWAKMPYGQAVHDMASLALRIGAYPRMLIATTPKPKVWLKKLIATPGVAVTHSTTWANAENLPPSYLAELTAQWEGRRLGAQELEGLIVEDEDAELFKEGWIIIDAVHPSTIERVAVGVDPSGGSDMTGIVACARLSDGRYAVLADRSCKGSPAHWSEEAIRLHDELEAEDLVAEVNYGGEMVQDVLKQTAIRMAEQGKREDGFLRVKTVVASRGKTVRAEPISALFEQGKVLMRSGLAPLQAEMLNFTTAWDRARDGSPNRLDSMVWALTRLSQITMNISIA